VLHILNSDCLGRRIRNKLNSMSPLQRSFAFDKGFRHRFLNRLAHSWDRQ